MNKVSGVVMFCQRLVLVTLAIAFALSGCGPTPSAQDKSTCAAVKRDLKISDDEYEICLSNPDKRSQWASKRFDLFAQYLTTSFNESLDSLAVRDPSSYVSILDVSLLPSGIDVFDEGNNLGKKYNVPARLALDVQLEEGEPPSVRIYSVTGSTDDIISGSRGVETNFLNSFQKAFIEEHCWLSDFDTKPSLCEGVAYLTVAKDPKGIIIGLELIGMQFNPADQSKVRAAFSR